MVNFEKFTLENGLTVIVHRDPFTPMVAMNIIYKVGSRDENLAKTAFAHLFEHLMFGGSLNVPNFDTPIQLAGGENNAFTNSDITNFYNTLPSENLETAFWLESDRMFSLNFSETSLDKQRKVVVEEFKETCLNEPYGDVWHHLMDLTYKQHPYRWPTIGLVPEHVEEATLEDVENFFYKFYRPNNAIIVVAGNCNLEQVKGLAEKWFGDIPKGDVPTRKLPQEMAQQEFRKKIHESAVPLDAPVFCPTKNAAVVASTHPTTASTIPTLSMIEPELLVLPLAVLLTSLGEVCPVVELDPVVPVVGSPDVPVV